MSSFTDFGKKMAEVQDELLAQQNHLEEVAGQLDMSPRTNKRSRFVAGLIAAAAIIALVATTVILTDSRAMIATVNGDEIEIGSWIGAPANAPTTVVFSDDSTILLEPSSGARITHIKENGATFLLERGVAQFNIIHKLQTSWHVDVGPYQVEITGTKFQLMWSPEQEKFALKLYEGTVIVKGPVVNKREIAQGETINIWVAERRMEVASNKPIDPPVKKQRPDTLDLSTDKALQDSIVRVVTKAQNKRNIKTSPRRSWQWLARHGKYSKAINKASEVDIFGVLANSSGDDLILLGDAARLSGSTKLATKSYKATRKRFAKSKHALIAAFSLGRMAFDQQRSYSRSAKWFELYLSEAPNGNLAREAMGRLMEAFYLAGNKDKASNVARQYLKRYPRGPHESFAKKITN